MTIKAQTTNGLVQLIVSEELDQALSELSYRDIHRLLQAIVDEVETRARGRRPDR